MSRNRIILFVLLAMATGYYLFIYPPRQMHMAAQSALDEISQAFESRDRASVAAILDKHITDNAKLHLQVSFFSLTQKGSQPVEEEFNKKEFLTFIDNVLYPLDSYHYTPNLTRFSSNDENSAADVVIDSKEWADGKSYYAGIAVGVRISSDTSCEGHMVFSGNLPAVDKISCKIMLNTVPKPEEAHKIQGNPEAMQQFLMR